MLIVTGGTGFLGEHVLRQFVARGIKPVCLVRPTSDSRVLEEMGLPLRVGDLGDVESLVQAFAGARILVNIASLGFGHAPSILEACRRVGVRRGVFVSTTAIFTSLPAPSKLVRLEAERQIKQSGMSWTIIRPTMIYGTHRDRNMARLVRYLARYPIIPVFGSGNCLQQPVYVEDLAEAIFAAVDCPQSHGRAYNCSGKEPLSYNEIIDTVAEVLGRRVAKVHIPVRLVRYALWLYERMVAKPALKSEQVLRLNEDKVFPYDEATRDLGFRPRSFVDGIRAEVELMRKNGLVS